MYYVLFTKILQGADTGTSGTVLPKRYSRICGRNPIERYTLTKCFWKFLSETELLQRYFSKILITTITTIV